MTAEQKSQIACMRSEGVAFNNIATTIGASVNTIKTYCSRHGLTVSDPPLIEIASIANRKTACQQCGRLLDPERKTVRFCSNTCKSKWWNAHPDMLRRSKARMHICMHCGKVFYSYTVRKYCCHPCYIAATFGVRV